MNTSSKCSRSDFFKGAGVIAGASVVAGSSVQAAEENAGKPAVALRKLGKTGLKVPVVSLGTGPGQEVNVMKFAIAQGMNFIHTSVGYKKGQSIQNVAEAIKGQRDKVVLGLKITWEPDDDQAMDKALETLGVDSADVAFFNIHEADQVRDPKYRRGAERWKKMGKFKHIGLTTHKETAECLKAGLDEGFYDVIMPSYTLSMEEEFLPIFERAEKEGLGIILMKTHKNLTGSEFEVTPHYLATTGITTINRGVSSFADIKKLIEASKAPLDKQAGIRLRASAQVAMSGHCRMCGECETACPQGFQVADVVRCSDYYLEHAEYVETAYDTYRGLARTPRTDLCGDCNRCERACRNGVPVAHHIRRAETVLA
ncbi:MAG: aldo/keto reductase [Pontiella sp.]|nr:aldo/keto reductase [Pontiella sp.]